MAVLVLVRKLRGRSGIRDVGRPQATAWLRVRVRGGSRARLTALVPFWLSHQDLDPDPPIRPTTMPTLLRLTSFRNAYMLRGLVVWVGLRVLVALGGVMNLGLPETAFVMSVVGVAVLLDARRRSEDLFLGNLGVPAWAIGLVGVPGALVAELLVP